MNQQRFASPTAPARSFAPKLAATTRRRAGNISIAFIALLSLTVAATGCGGNGSSNGSPAAAPPTGLSYSPAPTLTVGVPMATLAPTVGGGPATQYSVDPALPAGLALDPVTGAISGNPSSVYPPTIHTITASNSGGSVAFDLLFEVQAGSQLPVAEFVATVLSSSELGGAVNLRLALSDLSASDVTVVYTVAGTASAADYVVDSSPVVITAGTLLATIVFTPTNDGITEANETVIVTLASASGADIGPANIATVTISDATAGPCNFTYSDPSVEAGRFASIIPVTPSIGCGGATGYVIAPALPAGLVLGATTGVISGTPTAAQGPISYTVTASNAQGSTTTVITISVDEPLFDLFGLDVIISYLPANGVATGEISIYLQETPSDSQAGTRNIPGYSFGISVDSSKLVVTDVLEGSDQVALNGGQAAEFFVWNAVPGGITVGTIFDIEQGVFLVAGVPQEVVVVQFDAVPAFLIGNPNGSSVPLPFASDLGSPPVAVVISVGGQDAFPQTFTPIVHFIP